MQWNRPPFINLYESKGKHRLTQIRSLLMIRQRNRSKSLRFESSSCRIKIFSNRMFVTNACHLQDIFSWRLNGYQSFAPTKKLDKPSRKAWMRGNIDQLKFLIQTGLSRYTRTQNVLSSKFYSHETLVFGATDPSSKCRTCVTFVLSIGLSCQYLGCLSL